MHMYTLLPSNADNTDQILITFSSISRCTLSNSNGLCGLYSE